MYFSNGTEILSVYCMWSQVIFSVCCQSCHKTRMFFSVRVSSFRSVEYDRDILPPVEVSEVAFWFVSQQAVNRYSKESRVNQWEQVLCINADISVFRPLSLLCEIYLCNFVLFVTFLTLCRNIKMFYNFYFTYTDYWFCRLSVFQRDFCICRTLLMS